MLMIKNLRLKQILRHNSVSSTDSYQQFCICTANLDLTDSFPCINSLSKSN